MKTADASLKQRHQWVALVIIIGATVLVGGIMVLVAYATLQTSLTDITRPTSSGQAITTTPAFSTTTVVDGLQHPWDIIFVTSNQAIFSQRSGTLSVLKDGKASLLATVADVYARGEAGLLGLAIDPNFSTNHYIYSCLDSTKSGLDIRVVRWVVDASVTVLSNRQDIVTGLPANVSGRHSGCRLAFGPDGYLWIGTGDTATASVPQSPRSLGGKILRVDRNGLAAPGNLGGAFDPRIYSYGHRNVQGIAFAPTSIAGIIGYNAELGSSIDDEVNPLVPGNFGWDPDAAYTEANVPMTDKKKFPQAISAIWSSGTPTQSPSGANFITGAQWKAWNGALALAMLSGKHLKVLSIDASGNVVKEEKVLTNQGRLRMVREAPDGSLYILTDNGTNDKIIQLVVTN